MFKTLDWKCKGVLSLDLGIRLWNEIPCHMRVLPKNTFKKVLRTSPINILQNEDDYIQITVIIKKVGEVD